MGLEEGLVGPAVYSQPLRGPGQALAPAAGRSVGTEPFTVRDPALSSGGQCQNGVALLHSQLVLGELEDWLLGSENTPEFPSPFIIEAEPVEVPGGERACLRCGVWKG